MARLKAPEDAEIIVNRDQLEVMSTLIVAPPEGEILVGRAAAATGLTHPEWIVSELLSALEGGKSVRIGAKNKPPEEVLAHLFRRLKSDAEMRCGEAVSGAVVAHPNMWSEMACEALRRAGDLAGMSVAPVASAVAAAVGAGLRRPPSEIRRILVYDLGASDFAAALLTLEGKYLTLVKALELRGGGGAAFDQQIVDYVAVLAQRQHKVDPLADSRFMTKLRKEATGAKIALSSSRSVDLVFIGGLAGGAVDVDLAIEREEFERLIEHLVRATLTATQKLLDAVGWKAEDIDQVIPVGASTGVRLVRELLSEAFGAAKLSGADVRVCVALGAAFQTGPLAIGVQATPPAPGPAPPEPAAPKPVPPEPVPTPEPVISEDEIPTTPPDEVEDKPAVTDAAEDVAAASMVPEEVEAVSEQEGEEAKPISEVQTAETPLLDVAPAESAAPAVQLVWQVVEVRHQRHDFEQIAHVRIEGAVFHLATPRSTDEPVLDHTRVYLDDPVPGNLTLVLTLDNAKETLAVSAPTPPGALPGMAVDISLCVDLGTGIPYVTATFQGSGDGSAESISVNNWMSWTPAPTEPQATEETAVEPDRAAESVEPATPAAPAEPAVPVAPAEPVVPQTSVHRLYEQLEPLESGSNSQTFRSRDPESGAPALLCLYNSQDERARSAFLNSLLPLHVDHPNVVRVLDFGTAADGYFVVTEYTGGGSLRTLMGTRRERQPVAAEVLVPLAVQVCSGLHALHERHIFHRNLKPSNIWLDGERTAVKIADFQIAVQLRSGDLISQVSGTLPYMAKEVLEGRADHRADLYAVGVILFELLTGRLPFWANSQRQLADQITEQPAIGPRSLNANISEHLNEVVLRALEKDPGRRFQTAEELRTALLAEPEPSDRLLETITAQLPARG